MPIDAAHIIATRPETISRADVLSQPYGGHASIFADRFDHAREPCRVHIHAEDPDAQLVYLRVDDGETIAYYRSDVFMARFARHINS